MTYAIYIHAVKQLCAAELIKRHLHAAIHGALSAPDLVRFRSEMAMDDLRDVDAALNNMVLPDIEEARSVVAHYHRMAARD